MNIFVSFRNEIIDILKGLPIFHKASLEDIAFVVEPSRHESQGDVTTNAALVVARATGSPAMTLAHSLAQALQDHLFVSSCVAEEPGFLNLTFEDACWRGILKSNLIAEKFYGFSNAGKGEAVVIESPHIHKADSVSLVCYQASAYAEVLATLLSMMGYKVDRRFFSREGLQNIETRIQKGNQKIVIPVSSCKDQNLSVQLLADPDINAMLRFYLTSAHGTGNQSVETLLEKRKDFSLRNLLFSLHYAYARISSVRRHIDTFFPDKDLSAPALVESNLEGLTKEASSLIKLLAQWPYHLERVCVTLETQRIPLYLGTVARAFHQLTNQHNENAELHFVYPSDFQRTRLMFALLQGIKNVITAGLRLYEIVPLEELHGCM